MEYLSIVIVGVFPLLILLTLEFTTRKRKLSSKKKSKSK